MGKSALSMASQNFSEAMKPFWLTHVRRFLPLHVESIEVNHGQFSLSGRDWGFNSVSPSRLTDGKRVLVNSADAGFADALKSLTDYDIVECAVQGVSIGCDPCFVFSNGVRLEVFSDTGLEPWIMKLPTAPYLVADPTDVEWSSEATT